VTPAPIRLFLEDDAATQRLGADLALALRAGDLVFLSGDLGAGKSTLARALIRTMADDPELDVPSPTFTLVQAYDLRVPISHVDLYRIATADEVDELGLDDALESGAVLVEWPENGASALPPATWEIRLSMGPAGGRQVEITGSEAAMERVARTLAIRRFLLGIGRPVAQRRFLLGDASARSYEIVHEAGHPDSILMNAPQRPDGPPIRDGKPYSRIAHLAEDVRPFVALSGWLREQDMCAPAILASDIDQGLLLIEHLGEHGFLSETGEPVAERYEAAIDLLAEMHRRPPPGRIAYPGGVHDVPAYDRGAMLIEIELVTDWYMDHALSRPASDDERRTFLAAWEATFDLLDPRSRTLVLRDYHSPNIIWRSERSGSDRLGIIDFQDAMIGPAAYDVASLVQDARVTIRPDLARDLLARYIKARSADADFDSDSFERDYAIMAAQRASKILGIFVRLDRRDGKPGYLRHLPRIEAYLTTALAHRDLAPLAAWYATLGLKPEPRSD
jgi:N-acetylmuramate 1-kinase